MIEQPHKKVKAVGGNPGIIYGFCEVHKAVVDACASFHPILSAIGTPTYKLAKYLVQLLLMNFQQKIHFDLSLASYRQILIET